MPDLSGEGGTEKFISFGLLRDTAISFPTDETIFSANGNTISLENEVGQALETQVNSNGITIKIQDYNHGTYHNFLEFRVSFQQYSGSGSVYNASYGSSWIGSAGRSGSYAELNLFIDTSKTINEWISWFNEQAGGSVVVSLVSGPGYEGANNLSGTYYQSTSNFSSSTFENKNLKLTSSSGSVSTIEMNDFMIMTIKNNGEIIVIQDATQQTFNLANMDLYNPTINWPSNINIGVPRIVLGNSYNVIEKSQWQIANSLGLINELPAAHTYKNSGPAGQSSTEFQSSDQFFYDFYQEYLQLKQDVSSLSMYHLSDSLSSLSSDNLSSLSSDNLSSLSYSDA